MLQRHGTRNPNENQISKFPNIPPVSCAKKSIILRWKITIKFLQIQTSAVNNHKSGKGTLCPQDLALITDWKLNTNLTTNYAEFLAIAGWNELKNIATRYQRAFPTLLPSTYSRTKYLFRHSDTQRTQASFRAFADGLFGFNGYLQVTPEPIPARDLLLRVSWNELWNPSTNSLSLSSPSKAYDFCDPWLKNSALETEMAAFEKGTEYNQVISNVNKKLGWVALNY